LATSRRGDLAQGERQTKQNANLNQMIWNVAEQVSNLSRAFELMAGDIIYSGTPENVGPVVKGDVMDAHIDGLPDLKSRSFEASASPGRWRQTSCRQRTFEVFDARERFALDCRRACRVSYRSRPDSLPVSAEAKPMRHSLVRTLFSAGAFALALIAAASPEAAAQELKIAVGRRHHVDGSALLQPLPQQQHAAEHIFDKLVQMDADSKMIPGLATSWKVIDPTTWEFKLRKGVKFTDG
jgi:hypothetical protein